MKKNFLLTVCLAVASILGVSAQNGAGTIALHHDGKVTIYDGNKTQDAVDASVKGDTLYLSEGLFDGFNVTHGLVILGSGQNTLITENITITGNTEKKDLGDYEFGGLRLLKDFVVNDSVNGFKMSQCRMLNFTVNDGKFMDKAEISMSYISKTLSLTASIHGLVVTNSKVYLVSGSSNTSSATLFVNCNIWNFDYDSGHHEICYNSIVYIPRNAAIINCLYHSDQYGTYTNSWGFTNLDYDRGSLNTPFSDEELKSNGYLGTDGTVVGITGGVAPYTLELLAPHITEHQIEVDNVNRTLKVTLKMAGEAAKNDE